MKQTRTIGRRPRLLKVALVLLPVVLLCGPLSHVVDAHKKFTFTTTHANELDEGFFQGGVESQIKHIFETTLLGAHDGREQTGTLKKTEPSPPSVIDVGVNTGFFTLLSAAHGATVYGFELQRTCISRVREHLANNPHLSRRVYLFNLGLGQEADVVEGNTKDLCDGMWGHQGLERVLAKQDDGSGGSGSSSSSSSGGSSRTSSSSTSSTSSSSSTSSTSSSSSSSGSRRTSTTTSSSSVVLPDAVFQDWWDIALMKVDTEGAEASILKGFLKYIERGQIRNLVVEVVPSWWPKRGMSLEHGIQIFQQLQPVARETVLLHDMNPYTHGARERSSNIAGLPTFEITDMGALLRQRASTASSGLNIWFQF